jgi:hypothetical protein
VALRQARAEPFIEAGTSTVYGGSLAIPVAIPGPNWIENNVADSIR